MRCRSRRASNLERAGQAGVTSLDGAGQSAAASRNVSVTAPRLAPDGHPAPRPVAARCTPRSHAAGRSTVVSDCTDVGMAAPRRSSVKSLGSVKPVLSMPPSHPTHQVTYMSGNKRSARFPVSAAFQAGPVVEPDADYDARSTTWVARGRAPERAATRLAIVAGVLAVSAAIVYAFVRYRQISRRTERS